MPRSRRPRLTLAAVADHAGVSPTTASFVLSGRTDMRISTETSDRVRQSARVLGYTPRARLPGAGIDDRAPARAGRPPAIGLLTDLVGTDPLANALVRGAIAAGAERGQLVILASAASGPGQAAAPMEDLVDDLAGRGIDRFLLATTATQTVESPTALRGRPTVLLNCVSEDAAAPAVLPDEAAAGGLAVDALIQQGHGERIWLVGEVFAEEPEIAGPERLVGITEALKDHGLVLAEHVECPWWPPDVRRAVGRRLDAAAGHPPTAVIAINDRVALGVYQAAAAAGIRVPHDLSVVAFDNSDLAWWLDPALTSIALPHAEMSRRAVALLLAEPTESSGPTAGPVERVPMTLHPRASIAPPARR